MNIIEILSEKFQAIISECKIYDAAICGTDLCFSSEYDVNNDTYKNMISFLQSKGFDVEF